MFDIITPGGAAKVVPAQSPAPDPLPSPAAAPEANRNVVSQEDALRGAEHTKMGTFSVSDLSGTPGTSGAAGSSVRLGGLVQGKVAVDLMDAMIPALLVILFAKMKIGGIRKSDVQLTSAEKNTLAPIVEACLNTINLDFSNPWYALAISLIFIYGGKVTEKVGVAWVDRKADEIQGKPAQERQGPAPVIPMVNPTTNSGAGKAKAPAPVRTQDSTVTQSFELPPEIGAWNEEDLARVMRGRKCSRQKAEEWLNANWKKMGGVLNKY